MTHPPTISAESASLDPVIKPSSIVLVGASADPNRISGKPLANLIMGGFKGKLYPVNPRAPEIQGLKSYASVGDVPERPDLAIISLSSEGTLKALEECAKKGVRGAILLSAGYAEMSEEGAKLQDKLVAIARGANMRLVGPNCLGLFNTGIGHYASFTHLFTRGAPKLGDVGIISQSGSYGSSLVYLVREKGMGMRYWTTTGNEADVGVADWMLWMAEQPDVKVIMAYSEGIRDAGKFIRALEIARDAGKPVVMLKVGRSAAGGKAAASHTATLAGSDAVFEAVCRQYGVHRARTTEELLDIGYLCERGKFPQGRSLGIITVSGGVGVQMCDAAEDHGLQVPPVPEDTQKKLKALLPFASVTNPVDITAQIVNDVGLIKDNLRIMLEECSYDAIIASLGTTAGSPVLADAIRQAFVDGSRNHPEKLIILNFKVPAEITRSYEDLGFAAFEDVDRAIRAIAALAAMQERFRQPRPVAPSIAGAAQAIPKGEISELTAKGILAKAGVAVLKEALARSADEAVKAADELGYPVVMKIVSPQIVHKSDIGGVLLNVADAAAVKAGHALLLERARKHAPDAQIDGVLVAPMAPKGVETIIGVQVDPVFGPVVMFGLGGVLVEIFKDVSFRIAPFGEDEALRMIREIKGLPLLQGYRGAPPCDIAALAKTLSQVSVFAAANAAALQSVDINPFVSLPQGKGGLALDAVIVGKEG